MKELLQKLMDLMGSARCWFVVLPWETAVRIRLGRRTELFGPGWHFRIPGVDQQRIYNSRLRIAAFPCATVETVDRKVYTVAGLVGFRIADPLAAMCSMSAPETTASAVAMAAAAKYVSESSAGATAQGAEAAAAAEIHRLCVGISLEFVRVTDFAAVRTFRLLQDQWRPGTNPDVHQ